MSNIDDIDRSVQENVERIEATVVGTLRTAFDNVVGIAVRYDSYKVNPIEVLDTLSMEAARISDAVSPLTACRHKCSYCCNMSVLINTYEARVISEATNILFRVPRMSLDGEGMVNRYRNVRCPFLSDDNECSIYQHRPLACRSYINVSEYNSICDTSKSVQDVPSLDLRLFSAIYAEVSIDASLVCNDIREFFPNVINGVLKE